MSFAEGYKSSMGGPVEDQEDLNAIKAEGEKLGRQDAKNKGIKTLTGNLNSGVGPMKAGGFGSGFSLGADPAGSFAESRIASMKSNVSKAMDSTNRGSKIEKRWKDAGATKISKTEFNLPSGDTVNKYKATGGQYGYTLSSNEVTKFRERGKEGVTGSGAIPKAKDGISIHKGPGGNIIENIEGTPDKTRDKAIIYKAPKKVSIRKGDVTKGGTINTNQHIRGVKHYNQEEQTAQGVMTGANWQEKSRKYNTAAAQSKMLTKKEEKQQRKKEKKALVKGYRASSGIKSAMSKKTFLAKKGF